MVPPVETHVLAKSGSIIGEKKGNTKKKMVPYSSTGVSSRLQGPAGKRGTYKIGKDGGREVA